jgi:hypothetical protein
MEGKVHLIRYVEAVRDIEKDFSRVDPELTPLGKQQASDLADTSPHLNTSASFPLHCAEPFKQPFLLLRKC